MFSISRQTDYAARIVLHLACQEPGQRVSIVAMAQERKLPLPFVRRIVSCLVEKGIVSAVRGVGGGVSLAKAADELSLWDVVEAVEGPQCPSPCHAEPRSCPLSAGCPIRGVWTSTAHVLKNHLRSVLMSDLAGSSGHVLAHRRVVE